MSLRENYRQDPPEVHWKNPGPDNQGQEYCGHCGDDWPCRAVADGFAEDSVARAAADRSMAARHLPGWHAGDPRKDSEGELWAHEDSSDS